MKELQHLNKYFKKYKWRLILGFFIVIIARVLAILTPKFSGDMIKSIEDYVKNGGDYGAFSNIISGIDCACWDLFSKNKMFSSS